MLVLPLVEHSDDNHSGTYPSHCGLADVFWWNTILKPDTVKNRDDGRDLTDLIISQPAFISIWEMDEA